MSIFKTRFLSLVALLFYLSTAASSYAQQTSLRFLAEDLPPYHFINSQGQATGALVEIVQAMLIQAKLPGTIEIQPFARSYQNSQNQKNTFLFSLLKTPNRLEKFQWVGQTYKSYAVMVGL
ncbi:MAG: amino acid ABC transporter substrate-binding protein, partial [Cognaticolwellia sp.]